uniref:Apolipoprotein L n=1 Tax=Amphilophus citrinellus TaxID=61819 RepID=A0A3Q0SQL5_AMPCI
IVLSYREKLQESLCHYTKDIKQVIKFCEEFPKWKHAREEEIKNMMDIKDEADKISQSEKKGKASNWFRRRKLPKMTTDSRYEELEKELDKALTETPEGLKSLSCFLGAVEKLNEMLHFPEEINLLLLELKGEAKTLDIHKPFEVPKLENVEAMKHQLERYIDNMDKGAKISSVAGSSVGAVGGVLSIVGLALVPFTAGVSLALTMTGVGLGITSAVNSAVTTGTEIGVNDVQELQDSGKIAAKVGAIGKGIDSFVDAASAARAAGRLLEGGKGLRNASRVASDIPDIGQAVVKAPLAFSKTMRGLFIAGNVLFIGMDIFFICKDSMSLAKGNKTEVSQFIRARAALLQGSEIAFIPHISQLTQRLQYNKSQY